MKYNPSFDGIRAIAIIAVILCHWHAPLFSGGYLGVDLFFALSGYLITTILLNEWDRTSEIKLKMFYFRRVARLMPAYTIFLLTYGLVTALLTTTPATHWKSAVLSLFYVSNWTLALDMPFSKELGHTWSLCVEEQYYLLWPVFLVLMLKTRTSYKSILQITALVTVMLFYLIIFKKALGATDDYIYYATDTRIWTILSGSAIAVLIHSGWQPRTSFLNVAGIAGWSVIAAYFVIANEQSLGLLQVFLVTLSSVAIVAQCALGSNSAVVKCLSWEPFVKTGKMSYSLYLWHYPVFMLMVHPSIQLPYLFKFIIGNVCSIALAYFSYRFVEMPFLKLKSRTSPVSFATESAL